MKNASIVWVLTLMTSCEYGGSKGFFLQTPEAKAFIAEDQMVHVAFARVRKHFRNFMLGYTTMEMQRTGGNTYLANVVE